MDHTTPCHQLPVRSCDLLPLQDLLHLLHCHIWILLQELYLIQFMCTQLLSTHFLLHLHELLLQWCLTLQIVDVDASLRSSQINTSSSHHLSQLCLRIFSRTSRLLGLEVKLVLQRGQFILYHSQVWCLLICFRVTSKLAITLPLSQLLVEQQPVVQVLLLILLPCMLHLLDLIPLLTCKDSLVQFPTILLHLLVLLIHTSDSLEPTKLTSNSGYVIWV